MVALALIAATDRDATASASTGSAHGEACKCGLRCRGAACCCAPKARPRPNAPTGGPERPATDLQVEPESDATGLHQAGLPAGPCWGVDPAGDDAAPAKLAPVRPLQDALAIDLGGRGGDSGRLIPFPDSDRVPTNGPGRLDRPPKTGPAPA